MDNELFIVAVDLGGYTAPMLMPFSGTRCPATGVDVDHVAVAPGGEPATAVEEPGTTLPAKPKRSRSRRKASSAA